jgi:hypothetical protein
VGAEWDSKSVTGSKREQEKAEVMNAVGGVINLSF